jgi:hypothetical protein
MHELDELRVGQQAIVDCRGDRRVCAFGSSIVTSMTSEP